MKLIIGLGNPDTKYRATRHNLGATTIKTLIDQLHLTTKHHPKLLASITEHNNIKYATLDTYMNESGVAVNLIANYFKIDPSDIYIVHDDLDLAVGEWRQQFDRGPAGHNGIKSIISQLGTQAFHRIRLGIGHPQDNVTVENYVLLPFTADEKVLIKSTIDTILPVLQNPGS